MRRVKEHNKNRSGRVRIAESESAGFVDRITRLLQVHIPDLGRAKKRLPSGKKKNLFFIMEGQVLKSSPRLEVLKEGLRTNYGSWFSASKIWLLTPNCFNFWPQKTWTSIQEKLMRILFGSNQLVLLQLNNAMQHIETEYYILKSVLWIRIGIILADLDWPDPCRPRKKLNCSFLNSYE